MKQSKLSYCVEKFYLLVQIGKMCKLFRFCYANNYILHACDAFTTYFIFYFLFHLYVYSSNSQKSALVLYVGQEIIPSCFQRCEDIVVQLTLIYLGCFFLLARSSYLFLHQTVTNPIMLQIKAINKNLRTFNFTQNKKRLIAIY